MRQITVKILIMLAAVFFVAAMNSCDSSREDVAPRPDNEDIIEPTASALYTSPNEPLVLDLFENSNIFQEVSVSISRQPARGKASLLGGGLVMYEPGEDFTNGNDFFTYEVKSGENVLDRDTINIFIPTDSTQWPCRLIARADASFTKGTRPVELRVTDNDIFCGVDSTSITLSIRYNPSNGEAVVNNDNRSITYFPNAGFTGLDRFIYKLTATRNGVSVSDFAVARINVLPADTIPEPEPKDSCSVYFVTDDYATLQPGQGTIVVNPLQNDEYDCQGTPRLEEILTQPTNGMIVLEGNRVTYRPAMGFYGTDSIRYKGCVENACGTGTIIFNVPSPGCPAPIAQDDYLVVSDSVANMQELLVYDVALNDELCENEYFVQIISQPANGGASVNGTEIYYSSQYIPIRADSVQYQICGSYSQQCDTAWWYIQRED